MTPDKQRIKYLRAKDRVKKIRGFYGHLFIFCGVLLIAFLAPLFDFSFCLICFSNEHWFNLIGFIPWFIILCIHGLLAFGQIKSIKKWEEKKLKQFLEE